MQCNLIHTHNHIYVHTEGKLSFLKFTWQLKSAGFGGLTAHGLGTLGAWMDHQVIPELTAKVSRARADHDTKASILKLGTQHRGLQPSS